MKFAEYLSKLQAALEELQSTKRLIFGASCCERLAPIFSTNCAAINCSHPTALRDALDFIWHNALQPHALSSVRLHRLKESCERSLDEASRAIGGCPTAAAEEACISVILLCEAAMDLSVSSEKCARIAGYSWEILDEFIQHRNGFTAQKDDDERILNDPLLVDELAKQREDLDSLKVISLNPESLSRFKIRANLSKSPLISW